MRIAYPDYHNCGLNVISSIMNYCGSPIKHDTLPALDQMLKEKPYRNIVLMLFDGMAINALDQLLPKDSFLRTHMAHTLSAVFPSTTTAATTSIECAVSPAEHGWLGWTIYFEEIGRSVDIFINREQMSGEAAAEYHVASRYMPISPVFGRLNAQGVVKAACISPFGDPECHSLPEIREALLKIAAEPGRHYLYTYWGDPDHTMHEKGVYSPEAGEKVAEINAMVESIAEELSDDTLVLVTADHGLIDAAHLFVTDHKELLEMLIRPPTVEARVAAFHVKQEDIEAFPKVFREAFGSDFLLFTREQFLKSGLLGPGKKNQKLNSILGDYVAVATSEKCIDYSPEGVCLHGVHAGLTVQEMRVPLIVAKK